MPKLDKKTAKTVNKAEAVHGGGNFEPLEPGEYIAKLRDVTVRDNPDKYGQTQWSAEFDSLHSVETKTPAPGRQWMNLTIPHGGDMPDNYTNGATKWESYQNMTYGRLKAFFESFGYTVDSDTDEMLGDYAVISVRQRTIQSGVREGQITNEVSGIRSLDDAGIDDLDEYGIEIGFGDETF